MNILNDKHISKMDAITLDYTYKYPREYPGKTMCGVSSDSLQYHYEILLQMMLKEQIPDIFSIFKLLQGYEVFKAQEELASLGDMSLHRVIGDENFSGFFCFFCPLKLSDSQLLRLRMWYEYTKIRSCCLNFHVLSYQGFVDYEATSDVQSYFQQQQIMDDEFVLSLVKKYPNYCDFYDIAS